MNKKLLINNKNYNEWIVELSSKYRNSQIKASISVNSEMLKFYWGLGKDIHNVYIKYNYGNAFFDTLSKDLKRTIPSAKCFSPSNLRYMKRFYELFNCEEMKDKETNLPQVGENLFYVPWGHIKLLIDKFGKNNDFKKAYFFLDKAIENNWSRAILLNFLDTDLYERQGKAITNFNERLPSPNGELAQEITKDPYNFDFMIIKENYDEKELKERLLENIQRFLLELGTGFAFVGKEYRLLVGNTEEYLDLLLYNIKLHCYVVVEVKISAFGPQDIGQISTYVTAVNHILKDEKDEPTIGLLICKTKDNVLAQYAIESSNQPIGISEYKLSNTIAENYRGTLPSIEDIENELDY